MSLPEEKMNVLRELGQEIRLRREELGLSFDDIYQRTRIQPYYLDALENADYENLPDSVYTLGFIRTYLGMLRFDELYPEFRHWLLKNMRTPPGAAAVGPYDPPTPGFKLASRFWIFAVLLLVIFGAMTYVVYSWSKNGIPNIALRNDPGPAGPPSAVASVDISADVKSADVSADVKSADVPPPPPAPVKPSLNLAAADDCWISIRVGNGRIAERTLRKGETFSMELTDRTRVHYGRPWVITVTHNGKDIGSPYKSGVRRPQVNFYDPDGRSGRIEARQQP